MVASVSQILSEISRYEHFFVVVRHWPFIWAIYKVADDFPCQRAPFKAVAVIKCVEVPAGRVPEFRISFLSVA